MILTRIQENNDIDIRVVANLKCAWLPAPPGSNATGQRWAGAKQRSHAARGFKYGLVGGVECG